MSPSQDDRRRFTRIAFHRPASLDLGTRRADCEVLDISFKGALVKVPEAFTTGDGAQCTLVVSLDEGTASIRMEGDIAHRKGALVGIRCDEMDLESAAHLRRLVELNLGDDEVLHRELAALVADHSF